MSELVEKAETRAEKVWQALNSSASKERFEAYKEISWLSRAEEQAYWRGYYDCRCEMSETTLLAKDLAESHFDVVEIPRSTLKRERLCMTIAGLQHMYSMFLDAIRKDNFKENKRGWFESWLIKFFDIRPEKLLVAEEPYFWMRKFANEFAVALRQAHVVADIKIKVDSTVADGMLMVTAKTWRQND